MNGMLKFYFQDVSGPTEQNDISYNYRVSVSLGRHTHKSLFPVSRHTHRW